MPNLISPEQGYFALVAYIPDPLGSFLNSIRLGLPGEENPQAHITILPPRPLQVALEKACEEARQALRQFVAFTVELSDVSSFPETNILYLNINQGRQTLHQLHDALNGGVLFHEESFEFHPHLTLSGSVDADALEAVRANAEESWSKRTTPAAFEITEMVALWQSSETPKAWKRVWSFQLPNKSTSAAAVH